MVCCAGGVEASGVSARTVRVAMMILMGGSSWDGYPILPRRMSSCQSIAPMAPGAGPMASGCRRRTR